MKRQFFPYKSRLARREQKKTRRQIITASLALLTIFIVLIFWGLPGLIKMSAFLGDLRGAREPISLSDTTPPFPPQLFSLPESTNSAQLDIQGFSEAGSTVEIFLNEEKAGETVVGNDNNFILSGLTLTSGENKIRAYAFDQAGNKSQSSNTLFITYKKTPPGLLISEPTEGASYSKEKEIKVVGKTEPLVTLTLNERWVIVSSDGSFSASFSLTPGENILKIVATDKAGNQTIIERTVNFNP